MQTVGIGIIGCGSVSNSYLRVLTAAPEVGKIGCYDLRADLATTVADKYSIAVMDRQEMLNNPEIDILLNLTHPRAHAQITREGLEAGKHVYQEKPLATDLESALDLLQLAKAKGLRLASAPDTFLGRSLQTCRRLIDEGAIGHPIAFHAAVLSQGHEEWHPNPKFFYQEGAGPLFDMGPYYLSALVFLLGSIRRVNGVSKTPQSARQVLSGPSQGQDITVSVPTHVTALVELTGGQVGTLVASFDVPASRQPKMEIYGTSGTLAFDPGGYMTAVEIWQQHKQRWEAVEPCVQRGGRGLGVLEMITAISGQKPHRASATLAFHTLETMLAIQKSAKSKTAVDIASSEDRPKPLKTPILDPSIAKE